MKKTKVVHSDSVNKIVFTYLAAVTKRPFQVKDKTVNPMPLLVSHTLARGYTCPPLCGACCPIFSLDYLPFEDMPKGVSERLFELDGKHVQVYSDLQNDNPGSHCGHLTELDARCEIHLVRPFSCDFEVIRCYMGKALPYNRIGVGPYGRAHALTKFDSTKGTLCTIQEPTADSVRDNVRKLRRLEMWTTHFGLTETWIPDLIKYLEEGMWQDGNKILEV
jgi:hypothetical protein